MISKSELQDLLQTTETYRVERTSSTSVIQGVPQGDTQENLVTYLSHRPRKK